MGSQRRGQRLRAAGPRVASRRYPSTPPSRLRSQPRPFPRPDLARAVHPSPPSHVAGSAFLSPIPSPAHTFLAPTLPLHHTFPFFPRSGRPSPPRPLSLGTEPESLPLSPRPAASQPMPSHRCPHVRRSIRLSVPGPALTMPSGCRCLHLVCLLCILGAPVKPARGERSPGGLWSRPCPPVPRSHVDLCRPEMALQAAPTAGLATPRASLWNAISPCSTLPQSWAPPVTGTLRPFPGLASQAAEP